MSAPPALQRFAIEVQSFAGADWRDCGLRVYASDSDAALVVARREYPGAAGVWANLERLPFAGGRIGMRIVKA